MDQSDLHQAFDEIVSELNPEEIFPDAGYFNSITLINQTVDLYGLILKSLISIEYSTVMLEEVESNCLEDNPDLYSFSDEFQFWENEDIFDLTEYQYNESVLFRKRAAHISGIHIGLGELPEIGWEVLFRMMVAALPRALVEFRSSAVSNTMMDTSEIGDVQDTLSHFWNYSAYANYRTEGILNFWELFEKEYLTAVTDEGATEESLMKVAEFIKSFLMDLPKEERIITVLDLGSVQANILGSICKMYIGCDHSDFLVEVLKDLKEFFVSTYTKRNL